MGKKNIIFHKDKVLVREQSIFWINSLSGFLVDKIARNIELNSVNLIEITCSEISVDLSFKDGQWLTIREALNLINLEQFSLLARALSIIQWDKHHQYCGGCGKKTVLTQKSFERYCSICQINYYPRISPAIIVLIHRDDHLLMARSPHFPPGVYGLIAGFVEPGETLEATVHREVFEEVGIKIKNLAYYGSQPWPVPDSLMIGFTAEYKSGEILIDYKELEDAGWYRYDQLPGLPSFSKSISFQMIKQFQASLKV